MHRVVTVPKDHVYQRREGEVGTRTKAWNNAIGILFCKLAHERLIACARGHCTHSVRHGGHRLRWSWGVGRMTMDIDDMREYRRIGERV